MGDFLAIVKEKNFIEVVSRSINQVTISTTTRSKIGKIRWSLSRWTIQRREASTLRVSSTAWRAWRAWPGQTHFRKGHFPLVSRLRVKYEVQAPAFHRIRKSPFYLRESLDLSGGIPSSESYSFVGLLKRLKHRFGTILTISRYVFISLCRGLLKETRLPMEEYFPSGLTWVGQVSLIFYFPTEDCEFWSLKLRFT